MSFAVEAILRAVGLYAEAEAGVEKKLFRQFVAEVCSNTAAFDWLYKNLADEESRKVLDWAIRFRLVAFLSQSRQIAQQVAPPKITLTAYDGMLQEAKKRPEAEYEKNLDVDLIENFILDGYNLPNLCEVAEADIVLDLGGFNGNSAIALGRRCPKGHVYAFEPNPSMQDVLLRNIEKSGLRNIALVRAGLSNKNSKVKFRRDGAASRVDPKGDIEVELVAIDSWIEKSELKKIDFMKLDIEGFERHALRGASKTIRLHRPKLAVSIYHMFDDFTTLPKLIDSLGWYTYYLRHNAVTGGEIVLFCRPL